MKTCIVYYITGRACTHPYLHEVTTNDKREHPGGVIYVQPLVYITCILYTRNVGSLTLPHFDL